MAPDSILCILTIPVYSHVEGVDNARSLTLTIVPHVGITTQKASHQILVQPQPRTLTYFDLTSKKK